MRMLRKMNREVINCSGCLLRYIQWSLFLILTFLSGSIYYYCSRGYISTVSTTKEALNYYLACPPNGNLLSVLAFYFTTFLPVVFVLRFLDYKICVEYYIVRLTSHKYLVISKIYCIALLSAINIILRLLLFILCSKIYYPHITMLQKDIFISLAYMFILYITLDLVIFLFYTLTRSAITIFIIFSVLFLFSLYLNRGSISILLFWIYGLNFYNLNVNIIYGDLLLLIFLIVLLFVSHYDVIPNEQEKNE